MKVIYTVGIPGSGKSHFAKELAKKEKALILSSDEIRHELYGDSTIQKSRIIYRVLYERLNEYIKNGQSVIVDATNIDRERRMFSLNKLKGIQAECYYFDTPFDICMKRNQKRKRTVDYRILEKNRKDFQFPMLGEGFDDIHIVHEPKSYGIAKDEFVSLITNRPSYEELFKKLKKIPIFREMYQFNQENIHHQFLLCEHTYLVYQYIDEMYEQEDKLVLLLAALFHDIGKPFCKKYKPLKNSYGYYGHESVSSQIACHFLMELGFEKEFVLQVVNLIQLHMLIAFGGDEGASEIYHLVGGDALTKLYFFREADRFAK